MTSKRTLPQLAAVNVSKIGGNCMEVQELRVSFSLSLYLSPPPLPSLIVVVKRTRDARERKRDGNVRADCYLLRVPLCPSPPCANNAFSFVPPPPRLSLRAGFIIVNNSFLGAERTRRRFWPGTIITVASLCKCLESYIYRLENKRML